MSITQATRETTSTPRRVPLIKPDLPAFEDVEASFRQALATGQITNFGTHVTQLEREASDFLGVPAVTVSSGTVGLIFSLQALGIQPGQKVICPSFTFVATAQAIRYAGGVPLFADVDENLLLDVHDLESLLSAHDDVAAVIPVHMYGYPCDVEAIGQVARTASQAQSRPIRVLYDAAHAFGAERQGRRVGTFGDAEVFSLSATKLLVTVEGGMVASDNPDVIHRVRKMRNYGIEENYDAWWPGVNGKMSELHAIVGLHNLRRVPELLTRRKERAERYAGLIRATTAFSPMMPTGDVVHTYKDFTILVPSAWRDRRDSLIKLLADRGVETRAYFYPPVHEQRFFRAYADRPLPVTEDLARRVITLPFSTTISDDDMEYVVEALGDAQEALA